MSGLDLSKLTPDKEYQTPEAVLENVKFALSKGHVNFALEFIKEYGKQERSISSTQTLKSIKKLRPFLNDLPK